MKICCKDNKNKNSVNIYNIFNNEKKYVIMMELCDDNLKNILEKKKSGFNVEEIYEILEQLNNTFKIMVKNKIMNIGLNLEDILIKYLNEEKTEYIIKLSDYGLRKNLNSFYINNENLNKEYITAPEVLMKKNYNDKCDLWSLGIIIYQLFFKISSFNNNSKYKLINDIKSGKKVSIKTDNELLNDLISKLLKIESKERISWEEYFNHPFFKKFNKMKNNFKKEYLIKYIKF